MLLDNGHGPGAACDSPGNCKTCNKQYARAKRIKRVYGLEFVDLINYIRLFGEKCAICAKPSKGTRALNIDHCHRTKRVRGVLCWRCNKGLQCFYDSSVALARAADYVSSSFDMRKHDA